MNPEPITPRSFVDALTARGASVTEAVQTLARAICSGKSTAWRLYTGEQAPKPAATTLMTLWLSLPKARKYWPQDN